MILAITSGIYLIIYTNSHLESASNMCDIALKSGIREDDPIAAWYWGSCFKGKVYPFVPMEDYTAANGEKLYCDCKYSIIPEFIRIETAVEFINRMRSLRWIFWFSQFQGSNTTLITNPNLKVIYVDFHYPYRQGGTVNLSIDLSASTNLEIIYLDFKNLWPEKADVEEDPTITTAAMPGLKVLYCSTCELVNFNPCESELLKNL